MDGGDLLAFLCCLNSSVWLLPEEGVKVVCSCAEGKSGEIPFR